MVDFNKLLEEFKARKSAGEKEMALVAKGGSGTAFTPHEPGVHHAVCVDVVDLGIQVSKFLDANKQPKKQHKIRLVFQTALKIGDKRATVSKRYTLSLFEKANLRADLESWRGKPFTETELLDGWDVERVIGANALINVVHNTKDSKTYDNIVALMPVPKTYPKLIGEDYIRIKDRPAPPAGAPQEPPDDYPDAHELDAENHQAQYDASDSPF